MNKRDSIKCIFWFVIAILLIGTGNAQPLKSGIAALGCLMIISLAIYSIVKAKDENF
jgi:hypothetical protein